MSGVRPGFRREELIARYDVAAIHEDDWHTHSGNRTAKLVAAYLSLSHPTSNLLLNAGAGVYEIRSDTWREIALDLFAAPLGNRQSAVCGSVEALPFEDGMFGAVVCVGEVLGYCDPAKAIAEFSRVLVPGGILICDFGNSRSARYWLRKPYGRAADLVVDSYNGTPERIWVYDPSYVGALLVSTGFDIKARLGTHTWSALVRRFGMSVSTAVLVQRGLNWLPFPRAFADIMTIVAMRSVTGT
jgi:SAM-dependent methyltransferase